MGGPFLRGFSLGICRCLAVKGFLDGVIINEVSYNIMFFCIESEYM